MRKINIICLIPVAILTIAGILNVSFLYAGIKNGVNSVGAEIAVFVAPLYAFWIVLISGGVVIANIVHYSNQKKRVVFAFENKQHNDLMQSLKQDDGSVVSLEVMNCEKRSDVLMPNEASNNISMSDEDNRILKICKKRIIINSCFLIVLFVFVLLGIIFESFKIVPATIFLDLLSILVCCIIIALLGNVALITNIIFDVLDKKKHNVVAKEKCIKTEYTAGELINEKKN